MPHASYHACDGAVILTGVPNQSPLMRTAPDSDVTSRFLWAPTMHRRPAWLPFVIFVLWLRSTSCLPTFARAFSPCCRCGRVPRLRFGTTRGGDCNETDARQVTRLGAVARCSMPCHSRGDRLGGLVGRPSRRMRSSCRLDRSRPPSLQLRPARAWESVHRARSRARPSRPAGRTGPIDTSLIQSGATTLAQRRMTTQSATRSSPTV